MLYVFHGNDGNKPFDKAHNVVDSLLKKKPDASLFKMNKEDFDLGVLEGLILGSGLFEQKYIVFLDMRDFIAEDFDRTLDVLPKMQDSPHIFIIVGQVFNKPFLNKLNKFSQKVETHDLIKKESKPDFSMTNALAKKDKKSLWALYCEAILEGKEPEEIHGLLFWQVKNMLLAINSKTANEAGLKPYPFSNALAGAKVYGKENLISLSEKLVDVYHKSRAGITDLAQGIEKLILEM